MKDDIKENPYIAIGTMTLGDIVLDLFNCRKCKTTISKPYALKHYKTHYPEATGISLPIYDGKK